MTQIADVSEQRSRVLQNLRGGGEGKRRRRSSKGSIAWHTQHQESSSDRTNGRNREYDAPCGRGDRPPDEMRTCRAQCQRADKNADGQSPSFFKPAGGNLHSWRIDTCQCGAGEQPTRDRKSTRLNSSHRTISYAVF